jgi:hypothetical protein
VSRSVTLDPNQQYVDCWVPANPLLLAEAEFTVPS